MGFGNYDAWKLRSPDDDAAFRLGYDPIERQEREEEEAYLEQLAEPCLIDEYDLEEFVMPHPTDRDQWLVTL